MYINRVHTQKKCFLFKSDRLYSGTVPILHVPVRVILSRAKITILNDKRIDFFSRIYLQRGFAALLLRCERSDEKSALKKL